MFAPFCLLAANKGAEVCTVGNTAVLEINGTKLSLADLEQRDPAALFPARNVYYDAQRKAIDEFVAKDLLEEQAKREHVTVDQLLDKHVTSMLPKDPPEEALEVYYEGLDTDKPYQAVRSQILSAIRQRRLAKAKAAYLQSLRTQANISVLLQAPRAEISMKDVALRGPVQAPVTVVEYADYECPYCQQIQPALNKLEKEYEGKVAFAYKDYPLPMHSHAQKAAEASRCAEAQGKYWQYHDSLFADKQLEVPALKESARKLNLDETAFGECLDSGASANFIKLSSEEAEALGIQGTPTFFINGRILNGTLSYDHLKAAIEEELGKVPTQAQMARR
jgi:protein-disulfide isomerase